MTHHLLLLGGTTEARALAEHLALRTDLRVTLSLAGRTQSPAALPVPVRVGGFGGAEGLADYLRAEHVTMLLDATHPYAARISSNAALAARQAHVPLLTLRRPPWEKTTEDDWREIADVPAACAALGETPRRVFLALGRQEVAGFAQAPQHRYLIRSVDPIEPPLPMPDVTCLTARGPFTLADEGALLDAHRIEAIICKNSGGTASFAKLVAARARRLPVFLLTRPTMPQGPAFARMPQGPAFTRMPQGLAFTSVAETIAALDHALSRRAV